MPGSSPHKYHSLLSPLPLPLLSPPPPPAHTHHLFSVVGTGRAAREPGSLATESYRHSLNPPFSFAFQPIFGVQQQVARQAKAFLSLGKMAEVQASRRKGGGAPSWLWFATVKSLIGKGVMLAVSQGRVQTNVLNIANEDCIKVAAVLNNAFYLENLHFTIEGKDTHYFIKTTTPESDLGTLRLTSGRKALENGINVTVSQSTTVVNGRTRRFADVEMQFGALALHVRYGMTLDEEKARILEQARQRALARAWAREQQRVRDGEEGARLWTEGEKRQLLSAGKVQGYDGYYVLSVEQYPELADSANNIQFLRQSEIGKR